MTEKTNPRILMPRKCSAYDPRSSMIEVTYREGDKAQLYLDVNHRLLWFHMYCEEHGIEGIVDDSAVRYVAEASMWVATAVVYMDGKAVGTSSAGVSMTDSEKASIAVQTVCTFAKGRALANAGFNCFSGLCTSEDGAETPCDSGITISAQAASSVSDTQGIGNCAYSAERVSDNGRSENPQSQKPMTLEEARNIVMPQQSRYAGKSLSEVMGFQPRAITYFASDEFEARTPEYIRIKEACKLMLSSRE